MYNSGLTGFRIWDFGILQILTLRRTSLARFAEAFAWLTARQTFNSMGSISGWSLRSEAGFQAGYIY